MREFVVMVDRASGNESIGEMWTETCIFYDTATLSDVERWVNRRNHAGGPLPNVRIQIAERGDKEK